MKILNTLTKRAVICAAFLVSNLFVLAGSAWAVPAQQGLQAFRQPNGAIVQGRTIGDEHFQWLQTQTGEVFVLNKASGYYEYAVQKTVNGKPTLAPSGVAVGTGSAPLLSSTAGITNQSVLSSLWNEARKPFEEMRLRQWQLRQATLKSGSGGTATIMSTMTTSATAAAAAMPDVPLLLVLIDFTDFQFKSSDSAWQQKFFGAAEGTVNDYYREISSGRFKYVPAVESYGTANDGVVHVRLNYPNPNAGGYPHRTLSDALVLVDQYVNFASFDKNGDGKLDSKELSIVFILAGHDGDPPEWGTGTHAHAGGFATDGSQSTFDRVFIPFYVAAGDRNAERRADRPVTEADYHDTPMGVFAHELGHLTFILPDMYAVFDSAGNIAYGSNFGVWDLMGDGAWGMKSGDPYPGVTPPHMSAFSKMLAGFVTPTEYEMLYAPTNVSLYAPKNAGYNVAKINTNSAYAYYLVEHRRFEGYDRGITTDTSLYGKSGVMIYSGDVTSDIHKMFRMRATGYTDDPRIFRVGDMYYQGGNTRLAPNTTPNSLINGVNVGGVIEHVTASGDTMSVTIRRDDPSGYFNCKAYTATNSAHVSANRAYTASSGGFFSTTTYYAKGSAQSLGTSGSTNTTLKETSPGYFVKGTCSVNQKPVVQSVSASTNAGVTDVTIAVSDAERDLVRVEYQLDGGAWTKAIGTGNPTSGNFTYVTKFSGLANGNHTLNVRAVDAAGNVSNVYGKSIGIGVVTSCYSATNSAHASAGRATVKYSSLYYAVGSNDYLGTSNTITALQLQSANYWKKVASCP